ncbi:PP2C-domain-containing protein [Linderina pennispora]|uniref:protein-serine/threonine phosphatase n=1 Tax=Linderina pennispora TaxID=61395 RepID=A0A1Y1WDH0_9FUNG|nr:PP2C-domain-containing protein [Linderina pennispora]ORX71573.1 PP2C-domain-containing protein [Linderina pennispora]
MGQTLSEPVVDKHTTEGSDNKYIYGASAMQGWRITMEDAHTTLLKVGPDNESAFFAVYDGHGGQTSALFAGDQLQNFIVSNEHYAAGDFEKAIKAGYINADAELRKDPKMVNDSSGCTAVSVLITKEGKVYCGNAGDSRCIISTKGRAIALSNDHKPKDEIEFNRIMAGGGFVEFGRVNGNLALSRAIGDFEFKNNPALPAEKQIVTADPDVIGHKLSADDEFLVIACDGIWDCMTNQQVAQFVHEMVAKGLKLPQVCEELMDRCLASESELGGVGCDNMTVVIVGLLNGKTEDEWYAHVSTEINRPQGAAAAEIDEASERVNAVVQEIRSARAAGEGAKEEPAGASGAEEAPKPSDQ